MYGINTILYQRGLYPPETFTRKQEYGITLLVTTDEKLKKYLSDVLGQVKGIYMKHKQFFNTFLLYLLTTSILSLIFSTPKFQTLLFLSSLGQGLWRCPRCLSVRFINPPSIAITWRFLMYRSCQNLLCMLLISSSRISSIMAEKNSKWPIYCDFGHCMWIIRHCGHDNFKFNNGGGLLSSALLFILILMISDKPCQICPENVQLDQI